MSATALSSSFHTGHADIKISKFNALDQATREDCIETISSLNCSISTDGGLTTWEKYTDLIIERIQEYPTSQDTFFVAQDKERVVGYTAFYTRKDGISHPNHFIDDSQAYCSWTAVDDRYRGRGLAVSLKLPIFDSEHCIDSFRGHVKKTNTASLRVIEKFGEMGHKTSQLEIAHQVLYTIHKI